MTAISPQGPLPGIPSGNERRCLAGVFVGGKSTRMGGVAKGTLPSPDGRGTLVERLEGELRAAGIGEIVLVGEGDAYRGSPLPRIADRGNGVGPISGMWSLAEYGVRENFKFVIAIACDMPFLERQFLEWLATAYPLADALLPKREFWEPLCARYDARALLNVVTRQVKRGDYRLSHLVAEFGSTAVQLPLNAEQAQQLHDWDCPSDRLKL